MKKIFEDIAKEGELSYQVAKRFAKESTKEQFASKILEIIYSKSTDFEVINEIAFLCKSLEVNCVKNKSMERKMKEVTYEEWQKNPTPRMMWVWVNNVEEKKKERVIAILGQKNIKHRVLAVQGDYEYVKRFNHCAEIEEPKKRRMTNQELAWWLLDGIKEGKHREYKIVYGSFVSTSKDYFEEDSNSPVDEDIIIREDGGEWHEPLVEVEE